MVFSRVFELASSGQMSPAQKLAPEQADASMCALASDLEDVPDAGFHEKIEACLLELRALVRQSIVFGRAKLNRKAMSRVFEAVEQKDMKVARLWMSLADFSNLREGMDAGILSSVSLEEIRAGISARLWEAEVRISRAVPAGFAAPMLSFGSGDLDLFPGWVPETDQLVRL